MPCCRFGVVSSTARKSALALAAGDDGIAGLGEGLAALAMSASKLPQTKLLQHSIRRMRGTYCPRPADAIRTCP
jgi:hypothetical protein